MVPGKRRAGDVFSAEERREKWRVVDVDAAADEAVHVAVELTPVARERRLIELFEQRFPGALVADLPQQLSALLAHRRRRMVERRDQRRHQRHVADALDGIDGRVADVGVLQMRHDQRRQLLPCGRRTRLIRFSVRCVAAEFGGEAPEGAGAGFVVGGVFELLHQCRLHRALDRWCCGAAEQSRGERAHLGIVVDQQRRQRRLARSHVQQHIARGAAQHAVVDVAHERRRRRVAAFAIAFVERSAAHAPKRAQRVDAQLLGRAVVNDPHDRSDDEWRTRARREVAQCCCSAGVVGVFDIKAGDDVDKGSAGTIAFHVGQCRQCGGLLLAVDQINERADRGDVASSGAAGEVSDGGGAFFAGEISRRSLRRTQQRIDLCVARARGGRACGEADDDNDDKRSGHAHLNTPRP